MANTVVYRLITGNSWETGNSKRGLAAVLELYSHSGGAPRRVVVCETQTLVLNYGDRLKCVSGQISILINPGTAAGAFRLFSNLPACVNWNDRTELEINYETTKHIQRGAIGAMNDIGTIQTKSGGVTR